MLLVIGGLFQNKELLALQQFWEKHPDKKIRWKKANLRKMMTISSFGIEIFYFEQKRYPI